jgi:hypothetical protein
MNDVSGVQDNCCDNTVPTMTSLSIVATMCSDNDPRLWDVSPSCQKRNSRLDKYGPARKLFYAQTRASKHLKIIWT